MHRLGVHSHLFRGSPTAVAEAFRRHGLTCAQLTPNFPCLTFVYPEQITAERCREAAEPFERAGIPIVCLSGTTNLMDPDRSRRQRGIERLHCLIGHCRDFGTSRIVTETGSLSPLSPWAPYPPNRSPEAWGHLCRALRETLRVAEEHGVTLLLKPENTHVLAFVEDAVRLREEMAHPHLGFVMDPANFLVESAPQELSRNLEHLIEQLGPCAPVVHVKDLSFERNGIATPRAGRGVLDHGLLLRLLRRHQTDVPLILEHLRPDEIADTMTYLRSFSG
jgi:sugar phosphate isomerase/epimerase